MKSSLQQAAARREDRRRYDELPDRRVIVMSRYVMCLTALHGSSSVSVRNGFDGEQREIFEELVGAVQRKQVLGLERTHLTRHGKSAGFDVTRHKEC